MKTTVIVKMQPVNTILTRLGVDKNGDVQKFVTNTINNRITRYMPYRTGVLSTKSKHIKSPTEIEVMGPYANYQYVGKVRVNAKTGKGPALIPGVGYRYKKWTVTKLTNRPLNQEPHAPGNDRAGPNWDKRLMAAEGAQIAADVQAFVNRRSK